MTPPVSVHAADDDPTEVAAKSRGRLPRSRSWACPHPAEFRILVVRAGQDVLLQLSGVLDVDGRDAFDECVAAAVAEQPRRLVLDLSGLTSMDLVGVGSLGRALRRAEAAGVQLVLDSPNEHVLKVLQRADALKEFSIR